MQHVFRIIVFIVISGSVAAQSMDYQQLREILNTETDSLQGSEGSWQFMYRDRLMLLIADEAHNRMRIISPIHMADQLEPEDLKAAMTANFHSALDVRYAISEGVVWSAFLHPLRELGAKQLVDALAQVFHAAETFGTTYSSTELVFPGGGDRKVNQKPKKKM